MRSRTAIGIKLIVSLAVIITSIVALRTFSNESLPQIQSGQVDVLAKQLPTENGIIPVELRCQSAHLTAPNTLESFSCIIRNNTKKNIIAVSTAYTIVVESGGKEAGNKNFLTLESFIHPDLHKEHVHKSIPPGEERTIEPSGPITYEVGNPVVKRVEVAVDYVEFEDETTLGPNEKGSQIIADTRKGAAKYKDWLVQEYIKSGKSVDAIVPLLQKERPVPSKLEFKTSTERQGALTYRDHIRDIYNARGGKELEKYLNR